MSVTKKRISVYELEVGMFVSDLDRPWHETPFPIQGFQVKDTSDLDLISKFCLFVFIDAKEERERFHYDIGEEIPKGPKKESVQLSHIVVRNPVKYRNSTPMVEEIQACKGILKKSREVFSQINSGLPISPETVESVSELSLSMSESIVRNPHSLLWLSRIEAHSNRSYQHSLRMTVWSLTLARSLGLSQKLLGHLSNGCMLSQVGKISLPKALIDQEGQLDDQLLTQFKGYINAGVDMLKNEDIPRPALEIVQNHQERHNGGGFPNAVPGDKIPLLAQIAGLAYYYELLITPGPTSGRPPRSPSEALNIIYQLSDIKFHRDLVEAFIKSIGIYPIGSRVEISDGHIGIVLRHEPENRLSPTVILLRGPDGKNLAKRKTIDLKSTLSDDGSRLTIKRCLDDSSVPVKQHNR